MPIGKAYGSPDFNMLLTNVPEAHELYLLDLEWRYVSVQLTVQIWS